MRVKLDGITSWSGCWSAVSVRADPSLGSPWQRLVAKAWIAHWQQHGLMPECEPGKLLTWKVVDGAPQYGQMPESSSTNPAGRDRWYGKASAPYKIGELYHYPVTCCPRNCGSMVGAGPFGVCAAYTLHFSTSFVMGILANKDELIAQPDHHVSGGVFIAPRGVPVCVYSAKRVSKDQFDFMLVEGLPYLEMLEIGMDT